MSQINPFVYTVVQNIEAQRRGALDKEKQLRRAQTLEKNIATRDDELEHQVESAEETRPIGEEDEAPKRRQKRHDSKGEPSNNDDETDGHSHLDVTG